MCRGLECLDFCAVVLMLGLPVLLVGGFPVRGFLRGWIGLRLHPVRMRGFDQCPLLGLLDCWGIVM